MQIRSKINSLLSNFENKIETLNRIEILKKNILHNFDFFQKENPDCEIWPVLKSNAYGHGLTIIAKILKQRKFSYLVADSYFEALKIHEVSPQPVLLIGYTLPQNLRLMDFRKIATIIYDAETVKALGSIRQKIKVHLKINTGMNRQGINPEEVNNYLDLIKKYKNLELEGICSHLSDADGATDDYTRRQENIFLDAIKQIHAAGFSPRFFHLTNSAGSGKIKNPVCNTTRLGLGLYGYGAPELRPALRFITTLIKINKLQKGDKVSYNCSFTALKDMRIGVIPVGYYEGLDRRLSKNGSVKFHNNYLPILGKVNMNLTMIGLENIKIKKYDEIEVISSNPEAKNSIENMARLCKTIPYDILVKLNESTRRIKV